MNLLFALVVTLVPSNIDTASCKPDYKNGGYIVHNPLDKDIHPTFWCGNDWKRVKVTIPPGDTHVDFKTPEGESQVCFVDTWK